jgi:hypothetical protein
VTVADPTPESSRHRGIGRLDPALTQPGDPRQADALRPPHEAKPRAVTVAPVREHVLQPRWHHRALQRRAAAAAVPDLRRLPSDDACGHRPSRAQGLAVATGRNRPDAPGLRGPVALSRRRSGHLPALHATEVRQRDLARPHSAATSRVNRCGRGSGDGGDVLTVSPGPHKLRRPAGAADGPSAPE